MEITGYALAIVVGISLGLMGSGGSILTVPILVYVMHVEPVLATAYSLLIVGVTSLVGGIQSAIHKKVDFKTVLVFGVPSIIAVYFTRAEIVPRIPEFLFSVGDFQFTKSMAMMTLFSVVMILASISMIKPSKTETTAEQKEAKYSYLKLWLKGILIGILSGLVGAGGGFLIIPTLVILAKMPMKLAMGTSLFIIAANSILGFLGDVNGNESINWSLLITFMVLSVIGIVMGIMLSKKIEGKKLKTSFGWFVLLMGVYILVNELFI